MSKIKAAGMIPSHPGQFVKTEVLEPLGLNITQAARVLKVRRATLSDMLSGKTNLTPEMALRIEKAFDVKMEFLLRMQALYNAAVMRQKEDNIKEDNIDVKKFESAST